MDPKVREAQKADCADRRERAIAFYESIMDDPEAPMMARIIAADKMLDRMEGKPPQAALAGATPEPDNLHSDVKGRGHDAYVTSPASCPSVRGPARHIGRRPTAGDGHNAAKQLRDG